MPFVEISWPSSSLLSFPETNTPFYPSPFKNEYLNQTYDLFMKASTPMSIALVYFSFVHFINPIIRKRQLRLQQKLNEKNGAAAASKRLPAAPYGIARTWWFKLFVILHNVFLCIYSAWTFVGMVYTLRKTAKQYEEYIVDETHPKLSKMVQAVCDLDSGIFSDKLPLKNLSYYGFWFYMSKFYEVLDTIIILLKGRPSSLLQSYHHAGAMMCMWSGIRYRSPPIWIFVVFNSFIHTLMYFYFTLSCLKIRVPTIFKRILTSMQITQFIVGGSGAIVYVFLKYTNLETGELQHCLESSTRAFPLYINVAYLAPLTALFGAFYIESYLRKQPVKQKK
ncbi:elongation of fatty acids protein 1 [[Candida] railenensis]|uniref:Elongation of fatty acids protein n=1 Tax=[Candida] railenensis TaxID=45579 RepID=A0A9P0QSX0_9ASCO|nr:elongation of fatty acids protein 1 [[Candida] railenensis]